MYCPAQGLNSQLSVESYQSHSVLNPLNPFTIFTDYQESQADCRREEKKVKISKDGKRQRLCLNLNKVYN